MIKNVMLPRNVKFWISSQELQDALDQVNAVEATPETEATQATLGYEWYEWLAECAAQPAETLEEQALMAAREFSQNYPALGLTVHACKIVKKEQPEFYTDGWMFEIEFN